MGIGLLNDLPNDISEMLRITEAKTRLDIEYMKEIEIKPGKELDTDKIETMQIRSLELFARLTYLKNKWGIK